MTKADFTYEYCKEQVKKYGSIVKAAQANHNIEGRGVRGTSWRTVERWIGNVLRAGQDTDSQVLYQSPGNSRVVREVTATTEVVRLNANREPEVFTLNRRTVSTVPEMPSDFPIREAASRPILYNTAPYISHPIRYSVVVSDVQYGFLRGNDGVLWPIHDPSALDVAKQITAAIRPQALYFIGDWMDWPTFSRWQKYPEFYGCMQPSIDGGHSELGEFISAAGHNCTRRVMVGSNHQLRPEKFLLEHNMEALSIRRAKTTPLGWPVFSEQYLLRYDDLGIEFSGNYPGGEYWVNDTLVLTHAASGKLEFAADNIHGHSHRLNITTWTQNNRLGRQNYYQYDCGCLCQLIENPVPGSLMLTNVPSDRARIEGWSQGIAVIQELPTKVPRHDVHLIKIDKGLAVYEGQVYECH